jgi:peptidoglycan/LPS O-acetylase OafA/YrhL
MNNPETTKKALFANWALALFIIGILGAILIAALGPRQKDEAMQWALLFLGISEVLALVFGIVGWRHSTGKVAVFGAAGIVLLVAISLFWKSSPQQQRESLGGDANSTAPTERPLQPSSEPPRE